MLPRIIPSTLFACEDAEIGQPLFLEFKHVYVPSDVVPQTPSSFPCPIHPRCACRLLEGDFTYSIRPNCAFRPDYSVRRNELIIVASQPIKEGDNLKNELDRNGEKKLQLEQQLRDNADDKVRIEEEIGQNSGDQETAQEEVDQMKKAVDIVTDKLDGVE